MRFVCNSCRAQYMISDDKVGERGVKVRCKKCGYVIFVQRPEMGATEGEGTNPGHLHGGKQAAKILEGVADDEIGAIFDQALNPSSGPAPEETEASSGSETYPSWDSDQERTQAIDTSLLQKMLNESEARPPDEPSLPPEPEPRIEGTAYEWYAAVNEEQIGPLTFGKIKDLWDRGELAADSLCWRAGLPDWSPLSEIPDLASLLAPKPAKPVIVSPGPLAPAPVAAPIESAFFAGTTPRPFQVELSGAAAAESGGWKPSAASTLASLMKDEIQALARPESAPHHGPNGGMNASALSELAPADRKTSPSLHALNRAGSSGNSLDGFAAASKQGPYAGLQRAPSRGRWMAVAAGGILLVVLAVSATLLVSRSRTPEILPSHPAPQVAKAEPPPKPESLLAKPEQARPDLVPTKPDLTAVKAPPVVAKVDSAGADKAESQSVKPASLLGKSDSKPEPAVAKVEETPPSRPERRVTRRERISTHSSAKAAAEEANALAKKPEKPESVAKGGGGSDDEFDSVFGGTSKRSSAKNESPRKTSSVYIPPAPGSEIPDSLGPGEIMQVVVANKPVILKCAAEQKKKDATLAGKIVMRWSILPSGRTTNISCVSDQFKNSYMAQCISGLIKSWQFPRHKVAGEPIDFPFTF